MKYIQELSTSFASPMVFYTYLQPKATSSKNNCNTLVLQAQWVWLMRLLIGTHQRRYDNVT